MAEDLSVPARKAESEEHRSVYRRRFGLAYLALAILAGIGVGTGVLLIQRGEPASGAAWSNWEPAGRESTHPKQIAEYVSSRYKLPSGASLVGVLATRPRVETSDGPAPIQAVAIVNDPEGDQNDISFVETDNSMMYTMCGLGPQCSIREGQPSEERLQLLRREALELALYTFKYGDADSVIALLPPNLGEDLQDPQDDTRIALFFQKKDLNAELDHPLAQTLVSPRTPQIAEIPSVEALTIDRLTGDRLFQYDYTSTQSNGFLIVLAPVG
jgi:hypothetical protein